MELHYYLPRTDLREYVRAYYYFSTPVAAAQPLCAELGNIRILLDGAGRIQMPGGAEQRITSAFLIGPTMGAYRIDAEAGTKVLGVGIRPRGWRHLLGFDASEATDQVFDLTAIAGRIAGYAIEEIRNAPDLPTMAGAADRFFTRMLEKRERKSCTYPQALEHWLLNPDDLDLDRLLEAMDVSRRQTERIAKEHFGASPKMLQRKYRALRAADRIRGGVEDWHTVAGPAFYDQSHFIKEFKTFVGLTPRQFVTSQAELMARVQKLRRREDENSNIPLASI